MSYQFSSEFVFVAIIAIVVVRRLYLSVNGARFSVGRVFRLPVIYIVLTVSFVAFSYLKSFFFYTIAGCVVAFFALLLLGLRYSSDMEFFDRGGELYYKRKPYIMIIWLVALLSRVVLEVVASNFMFAIITVDVLMAASTGLITGEAVNTYRAHERHVNGKTKAEKKTRK